MIDASVNPRILHPPHPATPAGVARVWRVERRGGNVETREGPVDRRDAMRFLLTLLLIGTVGCGGDSPLPGVGAVPPTPADTPANVEEPTVQAAEADAAASEKPSETGVETSFRGLADSTPPELAWKATTIEEHKAWHTAFQTKMLEVLGRMPDRVPLKVKWVEKKRFERFTRHKIYIQTERTYWCPVYYLVPHEIKQRVPAIVCLHGHDGVVPYLGEGRKPDEPRPVLARDFARFFAEHGYVTALPIVRGWNETAGYQDPQGGSVKRSCQHVTMNSVLLGMSPAGLRCWDAMRVIDFLETQDEVDSKRIGLAGLSGGGTLSLYLPILDKRVKLVMMAGIFSSYRNSFFAMNHCICNLLPGVMQYGEMSDVVSLHAPRPVLLINGTRDESAPIADARQGLEKLKRVYTLLGVPERIEADFFDGPHEWSNGKTLEFLSKHFGK